MGQENNNRKIHKTTIGGQALIEGLMMIGPDKKAMAVRNAKGEIELEFLAGGKVSKAETIPFIRGPVRVFKQLVLGTKALMRSADIAESKENSETEIGESKSDKSDNTANLNNCSQKNFVVGGQKTEEIAETENAEMEITESNIVESKMSESAKKSVSDSAKDKKSSTKQSSNFGLYVSAIVSVLFSVIIFMLLPGLIVDGIKVLFKIDLSSRLISLALTLFEGIIRVGIFILYLWLVSKMDDIKRVWQYHGSEHKTIACYEARMPLTVENIRGFSRFHPRCGTSFMFLIMIVSIIILAFIGWRSRLINLIVRLLLLPVIAAITYEIIRLVGRYDNALTRVISKPGMAMQKLTTAEPDDSMIEVAIVAMEAVIPEQEGSDEW
ncbi:MAG: DUF1385 domain-containing protein [Clostridiaceae bacterium]|nr:DUF1385 domain-containing protein [Clostridiaceae bacterium]